MKTRLLLLLVSLIFCIDPAQAQVRKAIYNASDNVEKYVKNGDFAKAEEVCRKWLDRTDLSVGEREVAVATYYKLLRGQGRYAEAKTLLETANPQGPMRTNCYAYVLMNLQEYKNVIEYVLSQSTLTQNNRKMLVCAAAQLNQKELVYKFISTNVGPGGEYVFELNETLKFPLVDSIYFNLLPRYFNTAALMNAEEVLKNVQLTPENEVIYSKKREWDKAYGTIKEEWYDGRVEHKQAYEIMLRDDPSSPIGYLVRADKNLANANENSSKETYEMIFADLEQAFDRHVDEAKYSHFEPYTVYGRTIIGLGRAGKLSSIPRLTYDKIDEVATGFCEEQGRASLYSDWGLAELLAILYIKAPSDLTQFVTVAGMFYNDRVEWLEDIRKKYQRLVDEKFSSKEQDIQHYLHRIKWALDEKQRQKIAVGQQEELEQLKALAEKGDVGAMSNLGYLYGGNNGCERDDDQAFYWRRQAAERGDAVAQYNLSISYQNGRGCPVDMAQALIWCQKAADQGMTEAANDLPQLQAKVDAAETFQVVSMDKMNQLMGDCNKKRLAKNTLLLAYNYQDQVKETYETFLVFLNKYLKTNPKIDYYGTELIYGEEYEEMLKYSAPLVVIMPTGGGLSFMSSPPKSFEEFKTQLNNILKGQ